LDFLLGSVWSKKDVAFLWKRMRMDLSHESTKNFDPLLIVRDPYTQEQKTGKRRTIVMRSSGLRLQVFLTPFSLFAL
jgi:hypothetical protein